MYTFLNLFQLKTGAFKRILCALLIAVIAISLAGCGEKIDDAEGDTPVNSSDSEEIALEGYYLRLANEISDNGSVINRNYIVCQDEELTQAVGTLAATYDENGELEHYEAVIGVLSIEKLISYSVGDNGTFYTETSYDENGANDSSSWENIVTDPNTGITTEYIGTLSYYSSGIDHEFYEEQYITDGTERYLSCVTEREYSEDGSLASETVTNYDKDGNVL